MDARLQIRLRLLVALVVAFAASSPIARASEIVLTAFEPFGGLPVNNSAVVVEKLAWLLEGTPTLDRSDPVRISTCILPVEYDRAAKVALDCIGGRTPALVLSFGAGGCEIDFETRARNLDSSYSADNAGARRVNRPILPGGPKFVEFNAPMKSIYRMAPPFGSANHLSNDAGAYVCNNTAYWLGRMFATPGSPTRYGFIHVPPTSCSPITANADAIANTIYRGIRRAMPELF